MAIQNLANQQISASFINLMQVSSSGQLYDGTGSLITRVTVNSFTGSLSGSATNAVTASFAQITSNINPLNQNVVITGSLANGLTVTATGVYSHAEGSATQAIGFGSHAEGQATQASGDYSHTEGRFATASGEYSHAEGRLTIASGQYSHAEGFSTVASGLYSHAEGLSTNAVGLYSHAEGQSTQASGSYSHAEGQATQAVGMYSHAEGLQTIASGTYSHAEGNNTITSASYQHAQGAFNIASSQEAAFILGNGTSNANRSNLIFASGNQVQITGSLRVLGSITGSLQGTSTLIPIASSSISAGSIFFDTVENKLYIHNGTSWKTASLG